MDFSVFEVCFVLAFVGIGIARGYAETTEDTLTKLCAIISHNIPEKKWAEMCKKWVNDND